MVGAAAAAGHRFVWVLRTVVENRRRGTCSRLRDRKEDVGGVYVVGDAGASGCKLCM